MDLTNMITLKEYAKMHGKSYDGIRCSYRNGRFETVVKIGNQLFINKDEPLIDRRKTRFTKERNRNNM